MGRERQEPDGGPRVKGVRLARGLGIARGLLLIAGAAFVLTLVGLSQYGFPDRVTRRWVERLNRGDYAVELDRMTLDLSGGVVATSVRVYRKGAVGPPVFEAASVRMGVNLALWHRRGQMGFRQIDVRQGVLRRGAASLMAAPTADGGARGLAAACRLHRVEVFGVWVERGTAEVEFG